jgi:hypothetical protein
MSEYKFSADDLKILQWITVVKLRIRIKKGI